MTPIMYDYRQRKVYLSRSQSRVMAEYGAMGDPFGGPAYGEKNDPISAVAAGMSIMGGMSIGAGTFIGGLMIAGGVMSGLGALTGNKTLTTLGMVAGLAGGVTSFVQSGGFDRIGAAWSAGEGVGGGLSNVADTVFNGTDYRSLTAVGPEGYAGGNIASSAAPQVQGINEQILNSPSRAMSAQEFANAGRQGGLMSGPAAGVDPSAALANSAQPAAFPVTPAPAWTATGTQQVGATAPLQGLGGYGPENAAAGNLASTYGTATTEPSFGGGLMSMVKENPVASMMVANTLGQGVAGVANAQAAKDAAAAKKESDDANRQAGQPLNDAATRERNANAAMLEKKAAGIGATSIGKWGTNTTAGPWGKNPDGTPRTPQQYFAYMADRFSAAYGNGVPA